MYENSMILMQIFVKTTLTFRNPADLKNCRLQMATFANFLNAILLFNNKMSKLLHMYVPIPEQFERTATRRYVVVLKRRPAKTFDIRTPKRNQRRSASESNHPPIHLPHVRGSRDGLAQSPGDDATKPFNTNPIPCDFRAPFDRDLEEKKS